MKKNDTLDTLFATFAVITDTIVIYAGLLLAVWIRFYSGIIPSLIPFQSADFKTYLIASLFATITYLLTFNHLKMFIRPQTGSFVDKIPRIFKGCFISTTINLMLAFTVIRITDFSRTTILISTVTCFLLVTIERYILFRIEWNITRKSKDKNNILILGTDSSAAHLKETLQKETMLKANIIGFMQTNMSKPDPAIMQSEIVGNIISLEDFLKENHVDQIILSNSKLNHDKIVEIILLCERNLITFNMVLDLFRVLTSSMDVQSLNDIPLLGISKWPLDYFWKRVLKRCEDIIGASIALIITSPIILIATVLIKITSSGPIFFKQIRCGKNGTPFNMYKLRTMLVDAEKNTGPVFTAENDPRTTKTGAFLRKTNIDELPQLWNVITGDMSMVGPRPERPHFVEKFKTDISKYMWRHVSKPGMTGWAQVNGLRGNTSIEKRIKYDLYYLENWSLAFDLKILVRTLFANKNAY